MVTFDIPAMSSGYFVDIASTQLSVEPHSIQSWGLYNASDCVLKDVQNYCTLVQVVKACKQLWYKYSLTLIVVLAGFGGGQDKHFPLLAMNGLYLFLKLRPALTAF